MDMNTISLDSEIAISPDVMSRNNNDKTVILMKMDDSELFYKINGTAVEVWKLLQKKKSIGEIHKEILGRYSTTSETLATDIENFIVQLKNLKLIIQ